MAPSKELGDKLNLGCGRFKKPGFVNVDCDPGLEPDVVQDLNVLPYSFPSGHFRLIEADHVLEHLHEPFRVMAELHRLLQHGGQLVVRVRSLVSPLLFHLSEAVGKGIDFFANLSPLLCSRGWCFLVGGFEEIEFRFRKK